MAKNKNKEHSDSIVIDEKCLDWFISGNEGDLQGTVAETNEMTTSCDDNCENADVGPAPLQAFDLKENGDDILNYGHIETDGKSLLSKTDNKMIDAFQQSVESSEKKQSIQ